MNKFKYLFCGLFYLVILSNSFSKTVDVVDFAKNYLKENNFEFYIDQKLFNRDFISIDDSHNRSKVNFSKIQDLLSLKDLTLIKDDALNIYTIIKIRELRFRPELPIYYHESEFPEADNSYVHFVYKIKNLPDSDIISRQLRPFMSRYGRIGKIGETDLIILDNVKSLKRIIHLISQMDTVQMARDIEENSPKMKRSGQEEGLFSFKYPTKIELTIIILFSLVFMLWGFILRGYLIRKIEGGL